MILDILIIKIESRKLMLNTDLQKNVTEFEKNIKMYFIGPKTNNLS